MRFRGFALLCAGALFALGATSFANASERFASVDSGRTASVDTKTRGQRWTRLNTRLSGLFQPPMAVRSENATRRFRPLPQSERQASAMPRKSAAFKLAPPTSAPSTLASPSSTTALAGYTDPP
jgi:hypothetical protein